MLHFTFIGNKKNFGYYSTEKSDASQLKKTGLTYSQVMNQVKDVANRLVGSYGFSQEEALNLAMEKVTSDLGIPLGVIKAPPFPKSEPSEELSKRERDRIVYLANKTGYDGTDFNEAQKYLDNYLDNSPEPNSSIVPYGSSGIVPYNDPLDELSEDVEEYTSQSPIIASGSPQRSLLEGTRSMVPSPRGELLGNKYEEEYNPFIDVEVLDDSSKRGYLPGNPARRSLPSSPISRPSRNIIDRNTLQRLQKMPNRQALEKYKDITGGLFNRNPKLIKI